MASKSSSVRLGIPPADLTPAKARKEAQKVAGVWEEEAKQAYLKEQEEKAVAGELPPPAPVYTFDSFVNEVWIPLCVRDGSYRPATVAMYTNILKIILPQFKGVPLSEISGVRISQYLRGLRNEYRKPDGKPLAEKSIKHHYNVLNLIFGFAEKQDIIQKNPIQFFGYSKIQGSFCSISKTAVTTAATAACIFSYFPGLLDKGRFIPADSYVFRLARDDPICYNIRRDYLPQFRENNHKGVQNHG